VWGYYEDKDEVDDSISYQKRILPRYSKPKDPIMSLPELPDVVPTIPDVSTIEGIWVGHTFRADKMRTNGMVQLSIAKPTAEGDFEGHGYVLIPFTIKGKIEPSGPSTFKVTYSQKYVGSERFCTGILDGKTGIISGTWRSSDEAENISHPLHLIQMSPSLYRFRYTDAEFKSNPARARWKFACAAVLYQVKRRLWSWSLIKEKCSEKRRFIELKTRWEIGGANNVPMLTDEEDEELVQLRLRLSTADHVLYDTVYRLKKEEMFRLFARQ
jgi:Vacuolar sorting-associated protein 13, N-terminal